MNQEEFSHQKNLIVIDIREEYELETGIIPGSKHIPMAEIQFHLEEFKDKEVIFYCETGARSDFLVRMLAARGIKAHSLQGGIIAWLRFNNKL